MAQDPTDRGWSGEAAPEPAGPQPVAGSVRPLALVAAGVGLLVYLLGFIGPISVTSSFGGPLVVGGGFLAAAAVLPRAGRVLAPAAVLIGTGGLLLLQTGIGLGWPGVLLVATALAFLQLVAVVGAVLLDNQLLRSGPRRHPRHQPGPAGFAARRRQPAEYGLAGPGPPRGHAAAIGATAPPGRPPPEPPVDPAAAFAPPRPREPPSSDPPSPWHPAPPAGTEDPDGR